MPLNLHFHDNGWEAVSQNWNAWWAGELGGEGLALVINETLSPAEGKAFLDELRLLEKLT